MRQKVGEVKVQKNKSTVVFSSVPNIWHASNFASHQGTLDASNQLNYWSPAVCRILRTRSSNKNGTSYTKDARNWSSNVLTHRKKSVEFDMKCVPNVASPAAGATKSVREL